MTDYLRYARKSYDVAGYTYRADNYHAGCLPIDGLNYAEPEASLDVLAGEMRIDREEEHSYDSGDFPKVIFVDQLEGDPLRSVWLRVVSCQA